MTALKKEEVKELIREVMREDKAFFKSLIQEFIEQPIQEHKSMGTELERDEQVDAIIQRDFERYKNVFKALA